MEKPTLSFFVMDFVLLVLGVAFIFSVFSLEGFFFVFELVVLIVLLGILVIGMVGAFENKKNGWTVICATLILIALDVFFMFIISGDFGASSFITLAAAMIGVVVSLMGILSSKEDSVSSFEGEYYPTEMHDKPVVKSQDVKKEIKHEVQKESQEIKREIKKDLKGELKEEIKEEIKEQNVEKSFVPGKYIASRKANKFHVPKCDFANRIKRGNEIWFQTAEEAKAQGYEPDECV